MFVERGGRRMVSCSKDEWVKVWDLDTQHCCQTVVGHRCTARPASLGWAKKGQGWLGIWPLLPAGVAGIQAVGTGAAVLLEVVREAPLHAC